jgi:soluble lytic murein transglycosylase-like protein
LALILALLSLSTCSQGGSSMGWSLDFGAGMDAQVLRLASLRPEEIPAYIRNLAEVDAIADFASTPAGKKTVIDFFAGITGSEPVATAILDNALKYGVPPSLAIALAYEESGFNVRAVNKNGDSVDRGLFQLNSLAFPAVKAEEAFDPATSARYGLSHLAWFLQAGGNEVAALAMYNAGKNRVEKIGTPKRTLDYIFRITGYRDRISNLFAARVAIKVNGRLGSLVSATKVE